MIAVTQTDLDEFAVAELKFSSNLPECTILLSRNGTIDRRNGEEAVQQGELLFFGCGAIECTRHDIIFDPAKKQALCLGYLHYNNSLLFRKMALFGNDSLHEPRLFGADFPDRNAQPGLEYKQTQQ